MRAPLRTGVLNTPFQIGERKTSVRQVDFFKQGENTMDSEGTITEDDDDYYCPEEDRKIAWMREKRIKIIMKMELDNSRDELGWLIRCHNCLVDNCPEEEYPPRILPIPPNYWEGPRNITSRRSPIREIGDVLATTTRDNSEEPR